MNNKLARRAAGVLAVALALGTSACSVSTSPDSSDSGKKSEGIALPDSVKKKGAIDVGAFYNYPPYTQVKNGQLEGIEPELVRAVAKKLGVQARFHNLSFEAMIPSVVNGRSDMLIGMFADSAERRQQVSFVDVMRTEMRALVLNGNPRQVDPAHPCGLTAGEQNGSQQAAIEKTLSAQCVKDGKKPLKQLPFSDPGGPFLAVTNGRTDFTLQDPALAKYTAEQNKKLQMLDTPVAESDAQYQGWVFAKKGTTLQRAFVKAIKELIADGEWKKIMDRAGLEEAALNPPKVNTETVAAD